MLFGRRHSIPNKLRLSKVTGGIQIPSRKELSLRSRIMPTPLPAQLIIPLQQVGADSAIPVVAVGDTVRKYALLAGSESDALVPVFAPASGTVIALHQQHITVAANRQASIECLVLQTDTGGDESLALSGHDYRQLSPEDLCSLLASAGIIDTETASKDTQSLATLLTEARKTNVELLVINGIESDPYMSSEAAIAREYAEAVIQGAAILQVATGATRCAIAISANQQESRAALQSALSGSSIELIAAPDQYPAHDLGLVIGGLTRSTPATVNHGVNQGVLGLAMHTALAASERISNGKPCTSRITTITGMATQTPKNFCVPLGTPVKHLLALCGARDIAATTVVSQSALNGYAMQSLDEPIAQWHAGFIASAEDELANPQEPEPCIQCGHCITVCPRPLQPNQLLALTIKRDWQQLQQSGLADCIECGACAYVCPSHLPLLQTFRAGREELQLRQHGMQRSNYWQQRFNAHQTREAQEKTQQLEAQRLRKEQANAKAEPGFSRQQARSEIADAVARVKARRLASDKATTDTGKSGHSGEEQ